MKLENVLFAIETYTEIEVFTDNKKTSVFYPSPLRTSLLKKRHYDIIDIDVKNNTLVLNLQMDNKQSISSEINTLILSDLLQLVKSKERLVILFQMFHYNLPVYSKEKYLNHPVVKISVHEDILYIIIK